MIVSMETIAEGVWFAGIILFCILIFIGRNRRDRLMLNIGVVLLLISYTGMLAEPILSYSELATLQWGVRLGVTFILYDLVIRTEMPTTKEISASFRKLIKRGKK